MIHLKPCNNNTFQIELDILNSQPQYIQIAYGKSHLTEADIKQQHEEAVFYQTERFLAVMNESAIGLVEYGYNSPRQQLPWINLLCINSEFNREGYAKKVFQLVEQNMYNNKATQIILAVHATNPIALKFWHQQGFIPFDQRLIDGDCLISYHKKL